MLLLGNFVFELVFNGLTRYLEGVLSFVHWALK
jgi:hypothetical protein